MNKGSIIIPQSIVLQPYYIKMNKEKAEELTISFFKLRFPNKNIEFEKKLDYFWVWVNRFMSENV